MVEARSTTMDDDDTKIDHCMCWQSDRESTSAPCRIHTLLYHPNSLPCIVFSLPSWSCMLKKFSPWQQKKELSIRSSGFRELRMQKSVMHTYTHEFIDSEHPWWNEEKWWIWRGAMGTSFLFSSFFCFIYFFSFSYFFLYSIVLLQYSILWIRLFA